MGMFGMVPSVMEGGAPMITRPGKRESGKRGKRQEAGLKNKQTVAMIWGGKLIY